MTLINNNIKFLSLYLAGVNTPTMVLIRLIYHINTTGLLDFDNFSKLFTVHLFAVSPSWLAEPTNTSAILGSSAWMNCSAEGFPMPSIIWRKARGE